MATDPTRLYERFEPPERLTLVLEAMARDDDGEVARLQRSCPRKTYTQQDAEYEERVSMAFDIMAVVCIDVRAMWAKLHVLESVLDNARSVAVAHHVTAGLAFVEGVRCAQGLKPTDFFSRPLTAVATAAKAATVLGRRTTPTTTTMKTSGTRRRTRGRSRRRRWWTGVAAWRRYRSVRRSSRRATSPPCWTPWPESRRTW